MRKIKFRGIDTVTGKYVYGYYNPFLGDEKMPMIDVEEGSVAIEPGSLSQLIAVDKNGKEVYEGDEVEHVSGGFCFEATFDWYREINAGFVILKEKAS